MWHYRRGQVLNIIALLLSCITLSSRAEKIHLVKCNLRDASIIDEYKHSDPKDALAWRRRFSEMIDRKDIESDHEFSCDIVHDLVTTNNYTTPVKYLKKNSAGFFELRDDVKEGYQVECVINEDFNKEYASISLCLKKFDMIGRKTFDPVPEWDIGEPIIEEYVESKIDEKLFPYNKWDVVLIKEKGRMIEIKVIKVVKEKGSREGINPIN